jgi:uncharacterized membrane protein YidH (DUF202 family)
MQKIKDYSSTIALIASFGALIVSSFNNELFEQGATLIGMAGMVLVGEYFSVKNTGKTISKRFGEKSDNVKYTMSAIFVLWAVSLLVHLNI